MHRSLATCSADHEFTARSGARPRGLQAAPEEVREPPEHQAARRPAPRLRAIAHREVSEERGGEGDREACVGPLLQPRWHRREQKRDAEELGPRELHPEVGGEAKVELSWAKFLGIAL